MNIRTRITLVFALLITIFFTASQAMGLPGQGDEFSRARLLSYIMRQQLSMNHFSHKSFDDELSRAAFNLYLQQLDPQKRFLLQEDVKKLESYATRIDDEIRTGRIDLPGVASGIMKERIAPVRTMVRELMAEKMDPLRREQLETDPEKLAFCASAPDLRERWRKTLKYQVIGRYLNLLEDEKAKGEKSAQPPSGEISPELFKQAREKVLKSYEDLFDRMLEEKEEDHYHRFFDAVARAFDPHTNYLPPVEREDFDISMRGSLEGIGATLREEDGYIKVVAVIPGGAADRQGQLHAEDLILKVAEGMAEAVDVTDMRLRDAVRLIRGKKGSEVRLTIRKPDGTHSIIPIIRDVVQIEETFVKSTVLKDGKGDAFGYIKIPSFYRDFKATQDGGSGRNATDDVRRELASLKKQKISGLIVDLRNNGGGALTDAVYIAGLFIEQGPVVQVKEGNGDIQVLTDDDRSVEYDGPMVVLVNQFSASASEILAGALQDYGRAVILGSEHTHGKGTVQAMIDLDRTIPFPNMEKYRPLGALKVTIQKFYRVSGESTQYRGVVPDIILPDRLQHLKTGEQYMDYSLPWDTVNPTSYTRWSRPSGSILDRVRSRSLQRVQADKEFSEIVQDSGVARARSEKTLVSLHLEDLRQERVAAQKMESVGMHAVSELAGGDGGKNKEMTAEEKRNLWVKRLAEDPYADEAMAVLHDLMSFQLELQAVEPPDTPRKEASAS